MAIRAFVHGTSKVSPFDFGDTIRVHYKTDGRKIEGDFKAYKKDTTGWEFVWIEEDFYYEWYCWVETTYGFGEWKVEFIDRAAGITEEVVFQVGSFGEDICYKNVIIKQYGEVSVIDRYGHTIIRESVVQIKDFIDEHPTLFYGQCGDICDRKTEKGKIIVLEKCPDGVFDKRWKVCSAYGIWNEFSQNCNEVECYRNVIIHKSPYPSDPKWNIWTKDVGGYGLAAFDTLEQCKRYIDSAIKSGFTYNQCGEVVECIDGERRNETYCPDGTTLKSWEECISGEWKAKTQTCPVTCTEGEKRNVILCPDGEFMKSWEECVSGTWVAKTGVCGCAAGTTSCQGYNLYTCVDGEWVLKERNSVECGYTENEKISILDPIISWIETSFDVDRKTAEMYAYLGIAGIGAVVVLGVMSK